MPPLITRTWSSMCLIAPIKECDPSKENLERWDLSDIRSHKWARVHLGNQEYKDDSIPEAFLSKLCKHNQTMHYWLRWSIGFWNVQKVDKSRQLFLIQKTHQVIFAACFELVMTPILRRKKIWWRWYGIIGQNYGKCSKKVEDGLIRGWFFVWWKYRPYREKKLKIATLNETVFMVKLKL